ncbi:MAG: dTMP kinase [Trueperaceae bacterium]
MSSHKAPARGRFIVFEGPEGAGKSTQIARLKARLESLGRRPLLTREPGGTQAGEAMRRVLLDPDLQIAPLAEFLLYSAARSQHVHEVIAPALAAGQDVISDRFTGASVAYQGYGRGLDLQLIFELNAKATGGLKPDRTLLLDLDPGRGLARAAARAAQDRLESAGLEFHQRTRAGFLEQARTDPTWVVINADPDEETVADSVWRAVADLLVADGVEGSA